MPQIKTALWIGGLFALAALSSGHTEPKYPGLPSETPAMFVRPTYGADFESRDVMIPMRDGVKLHTVILVPKGARQAAMLLTRTPYDAKHMTALHPSLHLGARLWGYDNAVETIIEGGYIRCHSVPVPASRWATTRPSHGCVGW